MVLPASILLDSLLDPVWEGGHPGVDRGDGRIARGGTEADDACLVPALPVPAHKWTSAVPITGGVAVPARALHGLLHGEARPLQVDVAAVAVRHQWQWGAPQPPWLQITVNYLSLTFQKYWSEKLTYSRFE